MTGWTREAFESSRASLRARLDREFWTKCRIEGDCWVWTGHRQTRHARYQTGGYGVIRRHGRVLYAHRVAFERTHGPIPSGLLVMHSCDNPPCINPAHLSLGTVADNARDSLSKGREARGPLSPDIVRLIRTSPLWTAELARQLSLPQTTISAIRLRKTYRWVEAA